MKKVEIYSTPSCHYCVLVKDFLSQKGVKYVDYDVAADVSKRQEMVEVSGQMGVPVVKIGDEVVVGFDRETISKILGI
jgi:glutaredoxin-like YruB-family protein